MASQICTTLGQRSLVSGLGTGELATSLARLVDLRVVRSREAAAAAEMAARDGRTRIGGRSNVVQYAC